MTKRRGSQLTEPAKREPVEYVPKDPTEEITVHALNAAEFGVYGRNVFGWPADDSPTGFWSGIVVRTATFSVTVRDVRPAIVGARRE